MDIFFSTPIYIYETCFLILANMVGSYGLAIILLSILTSILLTPVLRFAEKINKEETVFQEVLTPQVKHLKSHFTGQELHQKIKILYARYSYHPVYAVRKVSILFVQLPFLVLTYFMLVNFEPISGQSFFLLKDLGAPDKLLAGFNLLPFIMTTINIIAALTMPWEQKRDLIQPFVLSLLFFVLLYTSPSALLLYWTMNQFCTVIKNVYSRNIRFRLSALNIIFLQKNKKNSIYKEYLEKTYEIFRYCFVLLCVVPFLLITSSPIEYQFIQFDIVLKIFTTLSCYIVIFLLLIFTVFRIFKLPKIFDTLFSFLLFWTVLAGCFLPIVASTGMVDLADIPINIPNLIIVSLLTLILTILSITSFKRYVFKTMSITIIVAFFFSVFSVGKGQVVEELLKEESLGLKLSNIKNIIVVSFDGLPGEIVQNILELNPAYSNEFKDFTLFQNAVSQSPATSASAMGEVYGIHSFKSMGENVEDVINKTKDTTLHNSLFFRNIEDTYSFGSYPRFGGKHLKLHSDIHSNVAETYHFFQFPFVRIFSSKILHILKYFDFFNNYSETSSNPETSFGPEWDIANFKKISDYNYFIGNISIGSSPFSVRKAHFTFTHFPVDFSKDGKRQSANKQWFQNNQNEEGIRNETEFAILKFIELIKKLKVLGVYDQSLIVFKSDHGKPLRWNKSHYFVKKPNNLAINGNTMWGYNRYRPVLLVKDFHKHRKTIYIEKELVLLNDLAKTLCEKSEVISSCQTFGGNNILTEDISRDGEYYLYVTPDKNANFKYETHIEVKIPTRKISLLKAMEDSPLINLTEFNKIQSPRINDLKSIKH